MNQVVEYELTPEDVRQFNLYHQTNSPTVRRAWWRVMLVLPLLLILPFGWLWFKFDPGVTPQERLAVIWYFLLPAPIFMLIFPLAYRRRVSKQISSMIHEGQNRGLFGWHRVELSPDGVLSSSKFSHGLTAWPGVERVAENDEYLLIYLSALSAVIIPRRAFANPLNYDEFAAAARKYLEQHRTPI